MGGKELLQVLKVGGAAVAVSFGFLLLANRVIDSDQWQKLDGTQFTIIAIITLIGAITCVVAVTLSSSRGTAPNTTTLPSVATQGLTENSSPDTFAVRPGFQVSFQREAANYVNERRLNRSELIYKLNGVIRRHFLVEPQHIHRVIVPIDVGLFIDVEKQGTSIIVHNLYHATVDPAVFDSFLCMVEEYIGYILGGIRQPGRLSRADAALEVREITQSAERLLDCAERYIALRAPLDATAQAHLLQARRSILQAANGEMDLGRILALLEVGATNIHKIITEFRPT